MLALTIPPNGGVTLYAADGTVFGRICNRRNHQNVKIAVELPRDIRVVRDEAKKKREVA